MTIKGLLRVTTIKKLLIIGIMLFIMIQNFIPIQTGMASETTFSQGTGYQAGTYDYEAQQPTAFNWTRQSKYTGNQAATVIWQFSTNSSVDSSPVIGSDGTIYFGSGDKSIYAVNSNGSKMWEYKTNKYIDSSAAIGADGTVYIGGRGLNNDSAIFALNTEGSLKWEFPYTGNINTSPSLSGDGTIYFTTQEGKLYALNQDGSVKWQFAVETETQIHSSPAIATDGTIYFGCYNGKLYAINPDGSEKWQTAVGGAIFDSSPTIASDGTIYIGAYDKKLHAINPDGSLKWDYLTGGSICTTAAVGKDGTIYFGSDDKYLYALNSDGTKKWQFYTENYVRSSPLVDWAGTVYISSYYKKLYAINPDGSKKWELQPEKRLTSSSPALGANGIIYIGSFDSVLYAIGYTPGAIEYELENYDVNESEANANITVVRSGGSNGEVTVDYQISAGTALEGEDYTAKDGTLIFADGETSKSFTIDINDDELNEDGETINLLLSNPSGGASIGNNATSLLTIGKSDIPGKIQFTDVTYNVYETDNTANITLEHIEGFDCAVKVIYETADGTATTGEDYNSVSGVVYFNVNENQKDFSIPIINDDIVEGSETIILTLSDPAGGSELGSNNPATLTIIDDEKPGIVGFAQASNIVSETDGSLIVSVVRTEGSDGEVTVDYVIVEGTAKEGVNYENVEGTLTFAEGETEKSFSINIIDDSMFKGENLTAELKLTNPTGGGELGENSTASLEIVDNEVSAFEFSAAGYRTEENTGIGSVTVKRLGETTGSMSVDYSINNATAVADQDFVSAEGTLTFNEGETEKAIVVNMLDDGIYEGNEYLNVVLNNPQGNEIGNAVLGDQASTLIAIKDNDPLVDGDTVFSQGAGYQPGAYDLNAIQPGSFNWKRQSRFVATNNPGIKWKYKTDAAITAGSAIGRDGTIYVKSRDGYLYALTNGGQRKWRYYIGNGSYGDISVDSSPTIGADGTIYVASFSGLYAINPNGSRKWCNSSIYTLASPVLGVDGTIYITANYRLYAINPNGSTKWSWKFNSWSKSTPAVGKDGTIYFGDDDENLYAINPNGTLKWTFHTAGFVQCAPAIADDGTIYITTGPGGGKLYAVNPDGTKKWEYRTGWWIYYCSPAIGQDGTIYLGSSDGYFYALNPSGSRKWRYRTGWGMSVSPMVDANGTIYAVTAGGSLFAFNPNGTKKWSLYDDGRLASSPTIGSDGAIYMGLISGEIWAIKEPPGTLSFSQSSYTSTENGGLASITVTRSEGSSGTVTVDYKTVDGTAIDGKDYTANKGVLTFTTGETSKNIEIEILDNDEYTGDRTINLELSYPTGGASLGDNTATLTITEDEKPGIVQFSESSYSVDENEGTVTVTVMRTEGSDCPVSVNYQMEDGSAKAGEDYTAVEGTIDFADGETEKSFSVAILDNNEYEGTGKTFNITLTNPKGGVVTGDISNTTVTISEDERPGLLQFAQSSYNVNENDGTVTISVIRTEGSDCLVSVDYCMEDDSAKAGQDYTAVEGTLEFAEGETEKTIIIDIIDNQKYSGTVKTATISLSNPEGGAVLGDGNITAINIQDDESCGLGFSLAEYSISEDSGNIVVTVKREGSLDSTARLDYHTVNGSATSGEDYTAVSGTLNYTSGESEKHISIEILDDNIYEGNKGFRIELSNPKEGTALTDQSTANITITDDENPGILQFEVASLSINEDSGIMEIAIARTGGSDCAVTVDYVTEDGTAIDGEDYTAVNGTLNFADGEIIKTISVKILDDGIFENEENFSIKLKNSTGGAVLGDIQELNVKLVDNEIPGIVQFEKSTSYISEGNESISLKIVRTEGFNCPISVDYTVGGTVNSNDYASSSGTLFFEAGEAEKDIIIEIADDNIAEGDEILEVILTSTQGGAVIGEKNFIRVLLIDNDIYDNGITPFRQGNNYEPGKYDRQAIQPTGYNWTRQSRFRATSQPELQWSVNAKYGSFNYIDASPVIARDGTIYVNPNNSSKLFAFRPDGSLKWFTWKTSNLGSSPVIDSDGTIYYSDCGYLHAVSSNGSEKWKKYISGYGSPALAADGTIYIDGMYLGIKYLYAYNPNGTLKWKYQTNAVMRGTPGIALDGTIYAVTEKGMLYALNSDGTLKWTYNMGGYSNDSSPVLTDDGTIYVCSSNSKFYAFNPDGTVKWSYYQKYVKFKEAPALADDGTIYFVSSEKKLYAFNPDGTKKWEYYTGAYMSSAPIIDSEGTIYFGSGNDLFAVNPNGTKKWSYRAGDSIMAPPAIGSDGTIYFASYEESKLYALKEDIVQLGFTKANYEASEADKTVTVSIMRTGGISKEATVEYKTENTTALAGRDYLVAKGTLLFGAGETEKSITIPIREDNLCEGQEAFSVRLLSLSDGELTNDTTVINIQDNDVETDVKLLQGHTNLQGDRVILSFSKTMNDPIDAADQFSVTVNGEAKNLSGVVLNNDRTRIDLLLADAVTSGSEILVSYRQGTIMATDGSILNVFTGKMAINNVPHVITSKKVNVVESQKVLAITNSTPQDVTVSVPENITEASLNVETNAPLGGRITSGVLPKMRIQAVTRVSALPVEVEIPSGATISTEEEYGWDGTLNVPSVRENDSVEVPAESGKISSVESVIEIGYGDIPLKFNKAVRIVIPGQAGKKVGYYQGNTFVLISTVLDNDSQAAGDALPDGGEGKIDVGSDLVVWTKHFTKFVTYTETNLVSDGDDESRGISYFTVTSEGGAISSLLWKLNVSTDSVSEDINIGIMKEHDTSKIIGPEGSVIASDIFEISKDKETPISKDIDISLQARNHFVGSNKYELAIYRCDKERIWNKLDGTLVDKKTGWVTGKTKILGQFAIFAIEKKDTTEALHDIKGHWAENTISEMVDLNVVSGYPDGTFKPDKNITRAEFTVMIVRAYKLRKENGTVFSDTVSHWAKDAIVTAQGHGIIGGYDSEHFKPDDLITREQIASIIARAEGIVVLERTLNYADADSISPWAKNVVASVVDKGLMKGYQDNTIRPIDKATRAEAVAVIARAVYK